MLPIEVTECPAPQNVPMIGREFSTAHSHSSDDRI